MGARRNFMLDDEAAALLDDHPEDNHSEIVRELVKSYYTVGRYDYEEAAADVRRRQLERQRAELEAEQQAVDAELSRLEDLLADDDGSTPVDDIADELRIAPDMATPDNPAIQRKAKEHGVDAAVLAEAVREQAAKRRRAGLKSVESD